MASHTLDPEPERNRHFQIQTHDWDLILSRYPSTIHLVAVSRASSGSTIALEIGQAHDADRISRRLVEAGKWLGGEHCETDTLRSAIEEAIDALRCGPPEMAQFILERAIRRE